MKYRKKPVEVEARQLTESTFGEVGEWAGVTECWGLDAPVPALLHVGDGTRHAHLGDWIVCQPDGALTVLKPHEFEREYTPAKDYAAPTDADRLWDLAHALGETKTRNGQPAMGWDGLLEKATRLQVWFTEHMRAVDAAEDVERARADR